MIIALDHGNKQMKSLHKTFTSGIVSSTLSFPPGSDTLFYNGKHYMLTEERIPYMRDKTSDERFFILSLFAIAYEIEYARRYVPGACINIDLAIGLPPGHYGKQYKAFQRYFLKNEHIKFELNEKKFCIYINSATAYPQGYAAIMPMYNQIKEYHRSIIIDLGGFSLDYLQLKEGKVDMSVCDTLELGVITLYNDIKSSVNSSEDMLIEESDIDSVIQNKSSVFESRIKSLIEEKSSQFVNKIIDSLRERKIDLKTTHAIFVGGGSILLKNYILTSKKIAVPDIIENINANAAGYDIMLRKKLQNGK